jgi:hypothetical protein
MKSRLLEIIAELEKLYADASEEVALSIEDALSSLTEAVSACD